MPEALLLKLAEDAYNDSSTYAGVGAKAGAAGGLLASLYKGLPVSRVAASTAFWGIAGLTGGGLISRNQPKTLNMKEETANV
jgi:hypothetical protein